MVSFEFEFQFCRVFQQVLKTDRGQFITVRRRYPRLGDCRGTEKLAKKTFKRILLEVVDDALASLGESARQAIYFHLETKFGLPKSEIPSHLEDFDSGLEKIFGPGARFLEIMIMRKLHTKLNQPMLWDEDKGLLFVDYVSAVRQSFLKKERN
jgi:hypothetical protein